MAIVEPKRERITRIVALLLFGGYALIIGQLLNVQITEADAFASKQDEISNRAGWERGKHEFERGRRGSIFDAKGTPVALGYDTYRLVCDPHYPVGRGPDHDERLEICADALDEVGVEFDRLDFLRRGRRGWIEIKTAEGKKATVKSRRRVLLDGLLPWERDYVQTVLGRSGAQVRGFTFELVSERENPSGGLMDEIVGFVGRTKLGGEQVRGRAGIEFALDRVLAGQRGSFVCERDGVGREYDLDGYWAIQPRDGRDVGLTIDVEIQAVVDRALRAVKEEFPCESVTGIVLDTQTGGILAIRGVPSATVADLRSDRAEVDDLRCRPAVDVYPPGSTFKPFIVARALEWGLVTWSDRFDTQGGRRRFSAGPASRWIKDSTPHEVLSLAEVIAKSSNIGMAMIGLERMGASRVHDAVCSFGFDQRLGILVPNEPRALFAKKKNVHPLYFPTSVSYGQEIAMTPLQLAARFSIFGTGGVYHEPKLVAWAGTKDERRVNRRSSQRMLRRDTAEAVKRAMELAVTDGTAKVLRDLDWPVAAKTGTAQLFDKNNQLMGYSSSLVALAPADKPQITVFVGVHGLTGATIYGGSTAGPAVKEIIDRTLRLRGVAPQRPHLEGKQR
jgi:cell division protein FtsI (penicillin-binding protein 3)